MNKTVEWYKDILGFETVMTVPESGELDWALMKKDSMEIMFQTLKSLSEELYPVKNTLPSKGSMILYINVENVSNLYNKLKEKVEIVKEIHKTFYGSEEFAIKDCNGFILMFAERKTD